MNDAKFGDLIGRMAISLIVVLALLLVAYRLIKRRQGSSFGTASRSLPGGLLLRFARPGRSGRSGALTASRAGNAKRGLKIVGRVGLSRTTTVVAVQFAERVFMLGTSEQGPPTVLAELELAAWASAIDTGEDLVPITRVPSAASALVGRQRPNLLEALREATARRA